MGGGGGMSEGRGVMQHLEIACSGGESGSVIRNIFAAFVQIAAAGEPPECLIGSGVCLEVFRDLWRQLSRSRRAPHRGIQSSFLPHHGLVLFVLPAWF